MFIMGADRIKVLLDSFWTAQQFIVWMFIKDFKLFAVFVFTAKVHLALIISIWVELGSLQSTSHAHWRLNLGSSGARRHGQLCALLQMRKPGAQGTQLKSRSFHDSRLNRWVKNAELFLPLKITQVVSFVSIFMKVVDDSIGDRGKRGHCAWSLWMETMETKHPVLCHCQKENVSPDISGSDPLHQLLLIFVQLLKLIGLINMLFSLGQKQK